MTKANTITIKAEISDDELRSVFEAGLKRISTTGITLQGLKAIAKDETPTELDIAQFKRELKDLLERYNACLGFNVSECSDTYGLYEERMEVSFDNYPEAVKLADGWGVCPHELAEDFTNE